MMISMTLMTVQKSSEKVKSNMKYFLLAALMAAGCDLEINPDVTIELEVLPPGDAGPDCGTGHADVSEVQEDTPTEGAAAPTPAQSVKK